MVRRTFTFLYSFFSDTFATEQLRAEFGLSLLNMKKFLLDCERKNSLVAENIRSAGGEDDRPHEGQLFSIIATTVPALLQKAGMEQVRQTL